MKAVRERRRRGFIVDPQQILSYTASMGFTPSKEIMTVNELIEEFDLSKVRRRRGVAGGAGSGGEGREGFAIVRT